MKTDLSLPVAWCVELQKQVTPEDILKFRAKNPDQKLTFLCPECQLPLTFYPCTTGIISQGYFKRRTGQHHHLCISRLKREYPVPQSVRVFHNFENAFMDVTNVCKDLRLFLPRFTHVHQKLCREITSELSVEEQALFHKLDSSFLRLQNPFFQLEVLLQEISENYATLKYSLRGY
ncbi:MAG: hypothetical protein GY915_03795 [bacterium]|nr:hypothetical protein [bacterium]